MCLIIVTSFKHVAGLAHMPGPFCYVTGAEKSLTSGLDQHSVLLQQTRHISNA